MDTKAIAEQIKDRKIKRVTEGQLLDWVQKQGNLVIQLCNDKSFTESLKDSLQKQYKVRIKKILFKNDDKMSLSKTEKELMAAYHYSIEKNLPLESNVQVIKNSQEILFTAPFIMNQKTFGIWSLLFSRKEAIRMIDMKNLK